VQKQTDEVCWGAYDSRGARGNLAVKGTFFEMLKLAGLAQARLLEKMRALVEIPPRWPDSTAGRVIDLIGGFNFLLRCAGSDFSFGLVVSREREGKEPMSWIATGRTRT